MKFLGFILFLIIVATAIIIGLEGALTHLVLAMAMAYLVFPIVKWLESFRLKRDYVVIGVLVSLSIIFILIIIASVRHLYDDAQIFLQNFPQFIDDALKELQKLSDRMGWGIVFEKEKITTLIKEYTSNLSDETIGSITSFVEQALSSTASILVSIANLYMLPLFFFYLVNDYEKIIEGVRSLIPKPMIPKVNYLLDQFNIILKNYLRGQLLLAGIRTILYAIGLVFLGVEFGLLLGLLTGMLSIIPYVGVSLGFVSSVLVALATDSGMGVMVGILVMFIVVYAVDEFWLKSKIIEQKSGLNNLMVMLVLMIGGNLFGIIGVFLAIPVAAIVKTILIEMKSEYQQSKYYIGSD